METHGLNRKRERGEGKIRNLLGTKAKMIGDRK